MIRERKIFKSMVAEVDWKNDPNAIPAYLDKHFKEKAKLKKERQMMGGMTDEIRDKIEEFDEVNTANRKLIDVKGAQEKKKKLIEQSII